MERRYLYGAAVLHTHRSCLVVWVDDDGDLPDDVPRFVRRKSGGGVGQRKLLVDVCTELLGLEQFLEDVEVSVVTGGRQPVIDLRHTSLRVLRECAPATSGKQYVHATGLDLGHCRIRRALGPVVVDDDLDTWEREVCVCVWWGN